MHVNSLPDFMVENYQKLCSPTTEDTLGCNLVRVLFEQGISFLGKLALLEYVQQEKRWEDFHYWLFLKLENVEKSQTARWLDVFRHTLPLLKKNSSSLVLDVLLEIYDRSPFLQSPEKEGRLKKLLWFHNLVLYGSFAASKTDLPEYREHLQEFLGEFSFLASTKYEVLDGKARLRYHGKTLELEPFFYTRLGGSEGLKLYQQESRELYSNFHHYWLPESYTRYLQQKKGKIDFNELFSANQPYVPVPWIESKLTEIFQDFPEQAWQFPVQRVLIEGYPGVGKTALASNLELLLPKWQGQICYYSFALHALAQKWQTFRAWFALQSKESQELEENSLPPIMVLDAIEYLSRDEFSELESFVQQHLSSNIWIFCKRYQTSNTPRFDRYLYLTPEDNLYFTNAFSHSYQQQLLNEYVGKDQNSQKIWRLLVANSPKQSHSVPEIAQQLPIHAPEALKALVKMQPLLTVSFEQATAQQCFRVFHPICQRFTQSPSETSFSDKLS